MKCIFRFCLLVLVAMFAGTAIAGHFFQTERAIVEPSRKAVSEPPEELSTRDWDNIQSQIQAQRLAARDQVGGGYVMLNSTFGLRIDYQPNGSTRVTRAADSVTWQLQRYGYGDRLVELNEAPALSASEQRVTYQWSSNLREWWVNALQGVEQWFELAEAPQGQANHQPLIVTWSLETELGVSLHDDVLRFHAADGTSRMTYDRIEVWDANGRVLPVRMSLNGAKLSVQIDDQGAAYPLTIRMALAQHAYLKASNTDAGDFFGWSVAVDGNTLVVGAPSEDSAATGVGGNIGQFDNSADGAGAAYIFVRSGTTWVQQAYLKASNTDAFDRFGGAVAVDGDIVVISADGEDSTATGVNGNQGSNSAGTSGAAYVFVRDGTGTWSQQAYLKASNTDPGDRFGSAVAVDGDTVVVGAERERANAIGINGNQDDNSAERAGAVYVFERAGTTWSQQAYLKASNTDAFDLFGRSVAISGNTIVVGAERERSNAIGINGNQDDNSAERAGAAYVFERVGTTWSQQAYLKASNTNAFDLFGWSVAVSDDTIVIGAFGEDSTATGVNGNQGSNAANSSGAAYVFVRDGKGIWSQQAYLKAANTDASDQFGRAVAVDGDTIVVGAPFEDSNATGVDGNQGSNSVGDSGAAYVFMRDGNDIWSQQAYLKASNTGINDAFGDSIAVSQSTVVIGATFEDSRSRGVNGDEGNDGEIDSGAAYVYGLPTFSISGSVLGLTGSGLVLQNNGGDDLAIGVNGPFVFLIPLSDGSDYNVTVATPPTGPSQICTVINGSGTISGADVTDIQVNCVAEPFTVGGTVTGLMGTGLVLQNNGGDALAIAVDGVFTFPMSLPDGSAYDVTVQIQPNSPSQTCTVSNAAGTVNGMDVTSVEIICETDIFSVGGTVSGLIGSGLALQNNGGDDLAIMADGAFTFLTPLLDGSSYSVTVLAQPSGPDQSCVVINSSGTLSGADVSDVLVQCEDITLGLSTADLDLGQIVLGTDASGAITVANPSAGILILSAIDPPDAPFSLSGGSCLPVPVTLAAGEMCTLEVTFAPSVEGSFSDQIVISSNAVSSPDTLTVRGSASVEPLVIPTLNRLGLLMLTGLCLLIGLFAIARGRTFPSR